MWKILALRHNQRNFDLEVPLCEAWKGLRNEELIEKSGIHDAEFVHKGGFIGGAWSRDSVLKMAEHSLQKYRDKELKKVFGFIPPK